MIENYEFLIEQCVTAQVAQIRGRPKTAIRNYILSLQSDPIGRSQDGYTDRKGRAVEITTLYGWEITYHVDHPVKEVKVLKLTKIS